MLTFGEWPSVFGDPKMTYSIASLIIAPPPRPATKAGGSRTVPDAQNSKFNGTALAPSQEAHFLANLPGLPVGMPGRGRFTSWRSLRRRWERSIPIRPPASSTTSLVCFVAMFSLADQSIVEENNFH
jgi:hypothetical protein